MKVAIIRNPVSGGRSGQVGWLRVRREIDRHFPVIEEHETVAGGTPLLARRIVEAGADLVIAVGGDGTISEVADGILSSSRPDTPLAFVPAGTGGDFARNFDLPRQPAAIAEAIAAAPLRKVDAGFLRCRAEDGAIAGRHFINIASFGVSGEVVRSVNAAERGGWLPGSLRFFVHSLRSILRYRPRDVRLVLDGREVHAGPVTTVAIANGGWFGGGMHVAPAADLSDGLFEVAVLGGAPTLETLMLLRKIYSGAHVGDPRVGFYRARSVLAEPLGDRPALLEADGETPGVIAASFEVKPAALTLKI